MWKTACLCFCTCMGMLLVASAEDQGVGEVVLGGGAPLRVLVGSPIRQKPQILKEFLDSLSHVSCRTCSLDFFFIDDNVVEESHSLLRQFQQDRGACCSIEGPERSESGSEYVCTEVTHIWKEDTIWEVAAFKDRIIERAKSNGYDYLFLIDSDIVLHPNTIEQLLSDQKDIVSNIFWTQFSPDKDILPQVWLTDTYTLEKFEDYETPSRNETMRRYHAFIDMLKSPGLYEVGGLGACTLISKDAIARGVKFQRLQNLTFWGEDRHFCVRAVALGLSLFVDTHLPACHIYRESLLQGVGHYKWACTNNARLPIVPRPRVTLSMCVRNEADRYLRTLLQKVRTYIDDAVIIDDASTDTTLEICRELLTGIPLRLIHNETSKFSSEWELRKQQWEETVRSQPDWILNLDADEIFEDSMAAQIHKMIMASDVDVYTFRLFDMWDETHYRDDQYWSAHRRYRPFLVRYKPGIVYQWRQSPQHCGRWPYTIEQFAARPSEVRLKHYGWARPQDRLQKLQRYMQLDPDARYGWKEQYDSILDEHPNLVAWSE